MMKMFKKKVNEDDLYHELSLLQDEISPDLIRHDNLLTELSCDIIKLLGILSNHSDEIALNRLQSMYKEWGLIITEEDWEEHMFPFEAKDAEITRKIAAEKGYIYHSTIGKREFWCKPNVK